jgi:formate hydrogenlyase subunit 3/multisubunit Na+/H+ antiporter MnhD subunit
MSLAQALLAATLALPLAMLAACLSQGVRKRMAPLLAAAPLPALAAAFLSVDAPPLVLGEARVRLALALDFPGALLLGVAALLWISAGAYATSYMRGVPNGGRFVVCWLMALSGCLGVFVVADMISFYLALAILTLGAAGLVFQDESPGARRAAAIYLGLALAGETLLLMGMVLLAAVIPGDSLLIRDAAAALPGSPLRDLTAALLVVGLGLKAGLVPLHVWMPLAHGAAPMPASAVLSGAVVKAGIIGLLRFLPLDHALPEWGAVLATAGLFTALYAVAIGVTQPHPKVVLAYSSVSQMGFVVAVVGMGLAAGDGGVALLAAFYAAHHVLVKGALFLAVGVVAATGARRLWPVLVPAAVIGVGLGGLPLTGGLLAKLAVKEPLGDGLAAMVAVVSAIGTTALMLHFLRRVATTAAPDPGSSAPPGLVLPWLIMAAASIAVPWVLWLGVPIGTVPEALGPEALWSALWPVLIGGVLAIALARWGDHLPRIPEGDVAVAIDGAVRAAVTGGAALERTDTALRQWPAAGLSVLAITAMFGAAMLAVR